MGKIGVRCLVVERVGVLDVHAAMRSPSEMNNARLTLWHGFQMLVEIFEIHAVVGGGLADEAAAVMVHIVHLSEVTLCWQVTS